jgi:hypothetical protein
MYMFTLRRWSHSCQRGGAPVLALTVYRFDEIFAVLMHEFIIAMRLHKIVDHKVAVILNQTLDCAICITCKEG